MDLAPVLPLATDRLERRLFTPGDVDDMYDCQRLAEVARYLYRPPRTRERCEAVVAERDEAPTWVRDGDKVTPPDGSFPAVRRFCLAG